ncbi:unnamed protein product [Nezara viridula]|uniref:Uncharacterized protein n=1 Tax=Nezara viridula TaxID=85310 RepID=A0A9P0H9K0_NEZVI|nr:unnamed protein product [Nezara viridula]
MSERKNINRHLHNEYKMSASELDKKYSIGDSEGKISGLKSPSKKQLNNKEGLRRSSSNFKEDVDYPRFMPVFKEFSGPMGYDTSRTDLEAKKYEKRSKNTADWLGLKDSPEKPHPIETIYQSKIRLSPEAEASLRARDRTLQNNNKIKKEKEVIDTNTVLPAPVPPVPTMKSRNRNKGILMNELFGDVKMSNEEPTVKIGLGRYKHYK